MYKYLLQQHTEMFYLNWNKHVKYNVLYSSYYNVFLNIGINKFKQQL